MSLPIGGFMPLPLPMMIPFMAAQSAAMAQAFGTYFQYGKRKISSMSNEEFNKLTPKIMHEGLTADIRAMIPTLAQSMHTYDSAMTEKIIEEFAAIAKAAISATATEVTETIGEGLELGVSTSKTQINDFLAALTAWMATMSQTHYVNPDTTVQQTNVSVKDIQLEQNIPYIETPSGPGGPDLKEKNNFQNKIANWNLNTLNAALSSSIYKQWQIDMLNKNKSKLVPEYQVQTTKETHPLTKEEESLEQWTKGLINLEADSLKWKSAQLHANNGNIDGNLQPNLKTGHLNRQKKLANHITLGRNSWNYLIKARAKVLYNQRHWKKF